MSNTSSSRLDGEYLDGGSNTAWDIGRVTVTRLSWSRRCSYCGIMLLTGENGKFCCGKGGKFLATVRELPPQSEEIKWLSLQPGISRLSRKLNLLFSFAAMETTGSFDRLPGPDGFLAIEGKVYHRLRPEKTGMGLRWVLYDGYDKGATPHGGRSVPMEWIEVLKRSLSRDNPFAKRLMNLRNQLLPAEFPNHVITLNANGSVGEIAAILRYDSTAIDSVEPRNLVVFLGRDDKVQIPTVSKLWEPLAYPLFFDKGTVGWGVSKASSSLSTFQSNTSDDSDINSTQMWYYRIMLLREERFKIFGRLANEYMVDMWTRELETRLYYFKMNSERRMREDAELMAVGNSDPQAFVKENVYLPANFTGSVLWASDNVSDALALAAIFGCPTFFVTVTCNPEWPEIIACLRSGQGFHDQPVTVARVFKQKLKNILLALGKMFPNAGRVLYKLHVIEFQKRGLPHAHILIKFEKDCILVDDIDKVISAEMPTDEVDKGLVTKFMMHSHKSIGPDGVVLNSCQKLTSSGRVKCRFSYPHALQNTTTIDFEGRVHYRRRKNGDQWVVPHCLELLRRFCCHINFEVANTSHIFSYLFKYVHKGPDRAIFSISGEDTSFNEIDLYWTGRYLSAGEAAWRILGFHITRKDPGVSCLPIHLESSKRHHQYYRKSGVMSVLSLLDRYFLRPRGEFRDRHGVVRLFSDLRYEEYYTLFRLAKYSEDGYRRDGYYVEKEPIDGQVRQLCILRDLKHSHVCRLESVRPSQGERFYLRSILSIRPAEDYADLRFFNGVRYSTYQETAQAMGIFSDEQECAIAFEEAVAFFKTPSQLRFLFVHMLVNECVGTPIEFWNTFKSQLSYDYYLEGRGNVLVAETRCLESINRYLEEYGRDLEDFGIDFHRPAEGEVFHEMAKWYPFLADLEVEALDARACMTEEQGIIFDDVVDAVEENMSMCVFLDGKAGTGKTHVIRAICSLLRSRSKIVVATATSAFAAQLYDGGRTTHSAFRIPVKSLNELLEAEINPQSQRADLLRLASLIIWDEAPMANKAVMECVDSILRKIMRKDLPFGGKVILLSGDFRQTCPVIPNGRREDIVEASIRSSFLWSDMKIYKLNVPIRQSEDDELRVFLDNIGESGLDEVEMKYLESCHSMADLIDFVFPQEILERPLECVTRSILCPTNRQIDLYNAELLKRINGECKSYLSADTIKEAIEAGVVAPNGYIDYHREHTPPGFPPHNLKVKVNGVYRLMRNLSVDRGLVKNCRVVVKALGIATISVQVVTKNGPMDVEVVLPRITFTYSIPGSGFTLYRKQFPLSPAYATTFNSCQGLTLDKVGIDLISPVFSHGQLYTALSRIRKRQDGMVRVRVGSNSVDNVTFDELLNF